jgi:hypothetical protein
MLFPSFSFRKHKEIAEDFITNILGLDYATTFISPQAGLSDFIGLEGYEDFPARIEERYGVNISDIKGDYLLDIFDLIARAKKSRK